MAALTLIELLFIVAILAIVVAVLPTTVVPGFRDYNAQAKASRVHSDQIVLALALEAYAVDHNKQYPAYGNSQDSVHASGDGALLFVPFVLTTPINYITSIPNDVFPGAHPHFNPAAGPATYMYRHNDAVVYQGRRMPGGFVQERYPSVTGSRAPVKWMIWSFGPDMVDDDGAILYDPSNGAISGGDIVRFGP